MQIYSVLLKINFSWSWYESEVDSSFYINSVSKKDNGFGSEKLSKCNNALNCTRFNNQQGATAIVKIMKNFLGNWHKCSLKLFNEWSFNRFKITKHKTYKTCCWIYLLYWKPCPNIWVLKKKVPWNEQKFVWTVSNHQNFAQRIRKKMCLVDYLAPLVIPVGAILYCWKAS